MSLCTSALLVLHLWSAHETHHHNNANYGAALECRNGSVIAQAGSYDNSFNRQTNYVAMGLEPYRFRVGGVAVTAGFLVGYTTGYREPVIGGFRLRAPLTKTLEAGLLFAPSTPSTTGVYHLTISWRFK